MSSPVPFRNVVVVERDQGWDETVPLAFDELHHRVKRVTPGWADLITDQNHSEITARLFRTFSFGLDDGGPEGPWAYVPQTLFRPVFRGSKRPFTLVTRDWMFTPVPPRLPPQPAVKNFFIEHKGTRGGAWGGWWALPDVVDSRVWERGPVIAFPTAPGWRPTPPYSRHSEIAALIGHGPRRPLFWDLTAEVGSELTACKDQPKWGVGGATTHGVGAAWRGKGTYHHLAADRRSGSLW